MPSSGVDHLRYENARELAVLRSGVLAGGLDHELAGVVEFAAAMNGTRFAGLSVITGHRQVLLATSGIDVVETPRHESFCTTTIQRPDEPMVVADAAVDPRFHDFLMVTGEPFIRFYAGVPIVDRDGFALGALCIADVVPRMAIFDTSDLERRAREVERIIRSIFC